MSIKSLFAADSVDSIIAAFDKQQSKLHVLSGKLRDAAAKHQKDADDLLSRVKSKQREADRALRVAGKIGELIG